MYRKICFILSTIFIFSLFGCNKSNKSDTQKLSAQSSPNAEKAPDQLKDIEKGIEKIFKALDGPVGINLEEDKGSKGQGKENQGATGAQKGSSPKPSPKSSPKSSPDSKQSQDSKSSSEGSEGGSSGKSDSNKSDTSDKSKEGNEDTSTQNQQPTKTDPWQEVSKAIQELHTYWDEYAPKSMKDGASKDMTDGFGNALNELTMIAMKKDGTSTMIATNQLYGNLTDFYYLYKTQVSPEVKKVKFYARDCIISAMKLNWFQTDTDIKNLKASFNVFKRSLDDKMKDKGTKIENSIYELEKVEKERNKELTDIKGRLVLKGTMNLEKEIDESSKK